MCYMVFILEVELVFVICQSILSPAKRKAITRQFNPDVLSWSSPVMTLSECIATRHVPRMDEYLGTVGNSPFTISWKFILDILYSNVVMGGIYGANNTN